MPELHFEILPPAQKEVWHLLAERAAFFGSAFSSFVDGLALARPSRWLTTAARSPTLARADRAPQGVCGLHRTPLRLARLPGCAFGGAWRVSIKSHKVQIRRTDGATAH
jgi:hypothetical protein